MIKDIKFYNNYFSLKVNSKSTTGGGVSSQIIPYKIRKLYKKLQE